MTPLLSAAKEVIYCWKERAYVEQIGAVPWLRQQGAAGLPHGGEGAVAHLECQGRFLGEGQGPPEGEGARGPPEVRPPPVGPGESAWRCTASSWGRRSP